MTSHVLLEGILDVKDPRGSGDRKFWKVWRRQKISFSVIYPSGRREPHLLLELSHCSAENPARQIRVQRDGLRIFRCRSKSRPYRTWAIMSGDKLVLYFGAESEMEAENWMKEVREGLWPSCFSFQMLTACSHEVSLIDDENTFLSGLLGVYGRFVLTSEDVISLMHPHWGCTLLQISLTNVQDVLFVREAEIPPAGVFSIVLKRNGDSKVKALQFFCNTALDAIQWILNKIYSNNGGKSNEMPKNKPTESSTFACDDIVSLKSNITENPDLRNTDSSCVNQSISTQIMNDPFINIVDPNTDYENLQYLNKNFVLNTDCITDNTLRTVEFGVRSKRNDSTGSTKQTWTPSRTNDSPIDFGKENDASQYIVNKLSNSKICEGPIYANITHVMNSPGGKSQNNDCIVNDSVLSKDSTPKCTNVLISNEQSGLKQKLVAPENLNGTSNSAIYSIVNKQNALKGSRQRIEEEQFLTKELSRSKESVINNHLLESKTSNLDDIIRSSKPSSTNPDDCEINCSVASSTNNLISDYLSMDLRTGLEKPMYCNVDSFAKDNVLTFHSLNDSNSNVSSTKPDNCETNCSVASSTNNSISDYMSMDLRTESEKPMYCNVDFFSKDNVSTFHSLNDSSLNAFGFVDKQIILHSTTEQKQSAQFSPNNFSSGQSFNAEQNHLFPNIPSDFLNTSINNSIKLRNKTGSECSSPDEDTKTLSWVIDDSFNFNFSERIYEDISDRKGTLYEEIDASESDDECTFQLPPSLPKRPQNLEIPNSLRLQKLSKSITQTLEVTESTAPPAKQYPRPKFIKKIKEVGRIMQISPTRESSREPFTVAMKLPVDTSKNVLKPTVVNPSVNINGRNESWKIFEPRNDS